uniref:Uncharacterized protein n=1 Tax=Solanum lycopersicum TaxID=4081 RepID=K4CQ41_SOLLC
MTMFMKMEKCTCSHRRHAHVNLASRKAKKSILKRIKANLVITNTLKFSNGEEEAIKKFNLSRCQHKKKKKNQICKALVVMIEPILWKRRVEERRTLEERSSVQFMFHFERSIFYHK